METWQIVLAVILAVNGFWLFLITCLLSTISKNLEQQSTAIILLIGNMINNIKGEKDNDTTGKKNT